MLSNPLRSNRRLLKLDEMGTRERVDHTQNFRVWRHCIFAGIWEGK